MSKLTSSYTVRSEIDASIICTSPDPASFRFNQGVESIEQSITDDLVIYGIGIEDYGRVIDVGDDRFIDDITIFTKPCEPDIKLLMKMSDKILKKLAPDVKEIVVKAIKDELNTDFLSYVQSPLLSQSEKAELMCGHIKYMTDRFQNL